MLRRLPKYLMSIFLMLFATGCNSANKPATQVIIPKSETATATSTSNIQNSSNTPTLLPSVEAPLPTLSHEAAYTRFQELLNNGGCRLPCWWGITPGKTTWNDAQRFLQTFTNMDIRDASNGFYVADVYLPVPQGKGSLSHTYYIKDQIVYWIEVFNFDWVPSLYLSHFLNTYGPPDEVFVRTVRHEEGGSQPFLIDLYYANFGILIEYSGGTPNQVGEKIQNCFDDMYSPFIYLWSPTKPMASSTAISTFLDTENLPYPISLYDATGKRIDMFYEEFKNPHKVKCLETPLNLWP